MLGEWRDIKLINKSVIHWYAHNLQNSRCNNKTLINTYAQTTNEAW